MGLRTPARWTSAAGLPPEKPVESPRGCRSVTWEGRERLKPVQGRIAPAYPQIRDIIRPSTFVPQRFRILGKN